MLRMNIMRVSTFLYLLGQGLSNIWRNKMFSLASVATMTICIFLFGVFYSIGENFAGIVSQAEKDVSVTVYFNEGITQEQIDDIGYQISTRSEAAEYRYISGDEAWEYYKEVWLEGREELAEGFTENPLADSSNYEVKLSDVSKQDELCKFLESLSGVREVKKSKELADVLTDLNNLIALIFSGIIIMLVLVAMFLINNTISIGISTRSEEIAIMKLIGAKDSFVRAPFIFEGVFIGVLGTILPLGILYFLYGNMLYYVNNKFVVITNLFTLVDRKIIFSVLLPISIAMGIGIGFLGSRMAVRRHLKV